MIRVAKESDLDEIMRIVRETIAVMTAENNSQWSAAYPALDDFQNDLKSGSLFICEEDGKVVGFLCINRTEAPEYAAVDWNSDETRFVLHRMAVDVTARRNGIGQRLLAFAEEYAVKSGAYYLRTDTFSRNSGMNALFRRCGFQKTGEVHFREIGEHFNCYDKRLKG